MEKYMEILTRKTPFDSFVSKRFKRDVFDIPEVREALDKEIKNLIKIIKNSKKSKILTILGDIGSGKTHLYWTLYNSLNLRKPEFYIVYISPQDTEIKDIYFTLCSNLLTDLGQKTLSLIASKIINIGGGKTTNLDFLGLIKIKKSPRTIINQVLKKIQLTEFQQNLMKAFIYLGAGTTFEREIALKWLKKEDLKPKELKKLDIQTNDFTEKEYEEIFKLIIKYIGAPLILFFDDIEYFQLLDKEKAFGNVIKNFSNNLESILIILTSLSESWDYFESLLETILKKEMKHVKKLNNFTEEEVADFYIKTMENFWYKNRLKIPPDPLFPLSEKILRIINVKSGGNSRLVKQLLKTAINQELYEIQIENLWELKDVIKK
ncbi:MAG: P-loop NTPase fold protein [Candidatus Helarchaeota archaeon]